MHADALTMTDQAGHYYPSVHADGHAIVHLGNVHYHAILPDLTRQLHNPPDSEDGTDTIELYKQYSLRLRNFGLMYV